MPSLLTLAFILIIVFAFVIVLLRHSRGMFASADYPYIKRKTLLTEAERSFLGVLEQAVGGQYRVYAQVRLADVVSVRSGLSRTRRMAAQNRINAKHVDFVLCDPMTLKLLCAIELDDASHQRVERKARDAFLEHACRAAGLPLARFSARQAYVVADVRASILSLLGEGRDVPVELPPRMEPVISALDDPPACPLCGSETVLRTVRRGAHAGRQLWGCKKYPACKGYTRAET